MNLKPILWKDYYVPDVYDPKAPKVLFQSEAELPFGALTIESAYNDNSAFIVVFELDDISEEFPTVDAAKAYAAEWLRLKIAELVE